MKHRRRHRTRTQRGGFLDGFATAVSDWTRSAWQKTKAAFGSKPPQPQPLQPQPQPQPQPPASRTEPRPEPVMKPQPQPQQEPDMEMKPMPAPQPAFQGGRTRRNRRKRGGAPYSGGITAKAQTWIGGKSRKRRRRH